MVEARETDWTPWRAAQPRAAIDQIGVARYRGSAMGSNGTGAAVPSKKQGLG
jgi:hypothetical protein